nr:uncharacterized protein LOC107395206 isoform X2 [Nothobranchius furzeri]
MLLLDETESFADQSHSAPFSSENEAQGGNPAMWHCTSPQSTSPTVETPAHPPSSQPASRPLSRTTSQSPAPPSATTGSKKRSSKPAHMRRNIRYCTQRINAKTPSHVYALQQGYSKISGHILIFRISPVGAPNDER